MAGCKIFLQSAVGKKGEEYGKKRNETDCKQ